MKRTIIRRTQITVESIETTTIRRGGTDIATEPPRRDWLMELRQLISADAPRQKAEFDVDVKGESK